jgi:G3E family GTPase
VTPQELAEVERRIRAINPYATLHRTQRSAVPLDAVLGRNAFDLDRILEIEPAFLETDDDHGHHHDHGDGHHHHGGLHHHHDDEIQSVAIALGEVDPEKFMPWINDLTQREGPNILRCKGILAFAKEPRRFVFQGVHMILDGDLQREWKPGEERRSRLVFIGRDLDAEAIRRGAEACAA